MAKKTTKKKTLTAADFQKAYLDFVRTNGKRPGSARGLCDAAELDLDVFYEHFKNLVALEKNLWLAWYDETIDVLAGSPEYAQYSAQERLFAFLYTWLETLEPHIDYIKLAPRFLNIFQPTELILMDFKRGYLAYTTDLSEIAKETGELIDRLVIERVFPDVFWLQLIFVLNYWMKDESEDKAKTDEAIERSVSLAFEWMGRNQLDSVFEFGKFLLEKKDGRTEEDTNG